MMLSAIRQELKEREKDFLRPVACLSAAAIRRRADEQGGYRLDFATDADRILHSKAYTRYIDKTQVFYMVRNDHITHRVLHVQLVSKIGRTIGRFLGLNEDLIEAIALGHDIGHPPFGHDGETILSKICRSHGLPYFLHNLQSVRFLDNIEKQGRGLNLTLQTLDGILCHDGEIHQQMLRPECRKTFADFDWQCRQKGENPALEIRPATMEGCVVRMADTIAYIGRDIEDAIELNLIKREDIPASCTEVMGSTNGTIVYRLVTDLIDRSHMKDYIAFSPEVSEALRELKAFNYQYIYLNPAIKKGAEKIAEYYQQLFNACLRHFQNSKRGPEVFEAFVSHLSAERIAATPPAGIVRDFIAGMTDDYFMTQVKGLVT